MPAFEEMGGSISTFSGMNSAGVTIGVLSKDIDKGLEIMADVIRNPVFPEEEIKKKKKRVIAFIKEQETDVFDKGFISFKKALYGDHPYGMRTEGEVDTVKNISRNDMIKFHKERFTPASCVMTIVGDVDIGEVIGIVKKNFGKWKGADKKITPVTVMPPGKSQRVDIDMPKEQSLFVAGFIGTDIKDERRFTLSVISSLVVTGRNQ